MGGSYSDFNTFAWIKFTIVKMDNQLNLNKHPCRDSIRDPLASEANPWTAEVCYLPMHVTYMVIYGL